jgi:hypothetical protein
VRERAPPSDQLEQLNNLKDPHKRGFAFQSFVASLFRREHFSVTPSPGLAPDRQIDLIATRHDESYLIETKWWKKRLGSNEVGGLLHRLSSAPPSMIGLLVGYSGFTEGAINRVEAQTDRPILLVTGGELERIAWDGHLLRLLRQKQTALQTDGKALFLTGWRTQPLGSVDALPTSPETFVRNVFWCNFLTWDYSNCRSRLAVFDGPRLSASDQDCQRRVVVRWCANLRILHHVHHN